MRKSLLALLLLVMATGIQAAVQLKEGHPERYTVVKGDTLWGLAERFLQKPWEWPQIWHINRQVANPHLIYPGDVLSLVYIDGQPRLTMARAESRGVIKLSPHVRSQPIAEAIPTIPLTAISSFLLGNRIIDSAEQLARAPYILAGNAERVISGQGDRVYARGNFTKPQPAYVLFRQGKSHVDPETQELLGINADDVGSAELVAVDAEVASLNLTRITQEVRLGDRLLPSEDRAINTTFTPAAPDKPVSGMILDVPRGVTQIGQFDVVILNKGARDGLEEGNVLAVYKKGETVRDRLTGEQIKIPDERAGLLMVFRLYEKLSYGLVLQASRSLSVEDRVRNP